MKMKENGNARVIPSSGGSRIWQGRVSNPSERGTGVGKAPDMRAEAPAGGLGPPPEN